MDLSYMEHILCTACKYRVVWMETGKNKSNTVFPHIVAAATILFWKLGCGNYSREETIQRRKLLISCFFYHHKNLI